MQKEKKEKKILKNIYPKGFAKKKYFNRRAAAGSLDWSTKNIFKGRNV